jgi:hypothetical protein
MGKKSGGGAQMPSPSEYIPLINAQSQANRVNTYTPFGSTVFQPASVMPAAPATMSAGNQNAAPGAVMDGNQRTMGLPGRAGLTALNQQLPAIPGRTTSGANAARSGGKMSDMLRQSHLQPSITPMESVTTFSPELQRLFEQQTGMAGSPIGNQAIRNRQNSLAFSSPVNPNIRDAQLSTAFSPIGDQELINRQRQMMLSQPGNQDVMARQQSLAMNPENFNQQIEQATFQRAMNQLEPGFAQQMREFEQQMANRGLPVGGEAYNDQFQNIQRAQNSARENAALSAVLAGNEAALRSRGQNFSELGSLVNQDLGIRGQQFGELSAFDAQNLARRGMGFQELGALANQDMAARGQNFSELNSLMGQDASNRGQQFNEIASLLGQNQITPPAPVDVMGPANMALNRNLANQQAQQGKKSSATNAGAMLGSAAIMAPAASDRRLKENIKKIGSLHNGLNVYEFNYIGHPEMNVGVMADEVEQVMPEAVYTRPDGYKMVYYGMVLNG